MPLVARSEDGFCILTFRVVFCLNPQMVSICFSITEWQEYIYHLYHILSLSFFYCQCLALPCSIYTMKKKDQEEVYLKMNFKKNVTIFLSHLHHMMLSMFSPVSDPE